MDVNAKPGGMISSFELGNRLRVKKTWSKEIRDLEEWKASKKVPKDRNAWNSFIKNYACVEDRR